MNELTKGFSSQRVMLSSSTGEHEDIKALFEKTVVGFQIHTIENLFFLLTVDVSDSLSAYFDNHANILVL
jgi:hypothetical protein